MNMNKDAASGKKWRRWIAVALCWLLIPVLILGGMEIMLRMFGYGTPAVPFRTIETSQGRYHICNFEYLYQMFTDIPNTAQADVEFVIPEKKEPNTYRIFVFGSSAAFGWTHSAGFAQMLQVMLMQRYPGVRFEVFNLANGGLNSSIMRPLAKACRQMQPDAYIIYMGNNEVHGPYGLITEFTVRNGRVPGPFEIELHQRLRQLRLGQLLGSVAQATDTKRGRTRGGSDRLYPDDPRLQQIWHNYEYNLQDMFQSGADAGAKVFVSTLGANLRHWPPQPDLVWQELSMDERTLFDQHMGTGINLEEQQKWEDALRIYQQAEAVTNTSPYLVFRQANCHWALGDYEHARSLYQQALEMDSFLWVRAKHAFNDTIRRAVKDYRGDNVVPVEGQVQLETAAPQATPGAESFADGCHFRPSGMYTLARSFFEEMCQQMPEWVRRHEDAQAPLPSLASILELLGFSEHLREDILEQLVRKSREHGMDSAVMLQDELDFIRANPITVDYRKQLHLLCRIIEAGTEDIQFCHKFMACLGKVPGSMDSHMLSLVVTLADKYIYDRVFQHQCATAFSFHDRDEERIRIYTRLLEVYPQDEESYLNLVPLLLKRDEVAEAQRVLRQAEKSGVKEELYHCLLGHMRAHLNERAAIDAYVQALKKDSVVYPHAVRGLRESLMLFPEAAAERAPTIRSLIKDLYAETGDWQLAEILEVLDTEQETLDLYLEIIAQSPNAQRTSTKLEELFLRWAEEGRDLAFWQEQNARYPDSVLVLLQLGLAYESQEKYPEALSVYEQAIKSDPENALILYRLGINNVKYGSLQQGMDYLVRAAAANKPEATEIAQRCNEMATLFQEQGNHEAAIQLYRLALKISPTDLWPRVRLAQLFEEVRDFDSAENEYKQVLMSTPESPITAGLLHTLLKKRAESGTQEAYWASLVAMHPQAAVPMFYLGLAQEQSNNHQKALAAYQHVLEIKPGDPQALYRLGALEILQGNVDSGLEQMMEASRQADHMSADISTRLGEIAAHFARTDNPVIAARLYYQALAVSPDDLWPLVRIGELYETQGRDAEALEAYRSVLLKRPESPVTAKKMQALLEKTQTPPEQIRTEWVNILETHHEAAVPLYYLGKTLEALGDVAGAQPVYERARRTNPDIEHIITGDSPY